MSRKRQVPVGLKLKGNSEKHVLREGRVDPGRVRPAVAPDTTPPTRDANDPMIEFYRDTFRLAGGEGSADLRHDEGFGGALDQLLEHPDDQRIAVEGILQRVASVVVMQEVCDMA